MIKRGYNKNFVYGLLAAGGTLGILIPPSLPMIVYGFITEDKTERDIFLHVSALESSKLRTLKEEQKIEFDIKEEKDKLQAINLKKV